MRLLPRAGQALNLTLATIALALLVGAGTSSAAPRLELTAADGALTISNSKDGAAIFRAAAMRPGEQASGSVRIGNTGTVDATLNVARTAAPVDTAGTGGGRLSSRLELRVIDITHAQSPVTLYSGRLAAMPSTALGGLAPGAQREFLFVATLPPAGAADNAYQGAALAAGFTWTAQGAAVVTPTPTPTRPRRPTRTPTPAPPRTPAPPPPPAAVTPPPPGSVGPDSALADQVFAMPSARTCVSRRRFQIHIRRPRGVAFKSIRITLNGRAKIRAKGLKARKLKARVNLRGLPKGRVVLKIVARTTTGAKLVSKRTYHTCAKRKIKKSRKKRRR